ncbi:MAG: yehT 1 [Gemmatimonadetes bacterium]|nr:yehT 1 [Gemmatimonadota bacterium]
MKTIRAIVVDDEPLARDLLRTMLAAEPDMEIVGEYGNGEDAVNAILEDTPDLVFLDVQMPELDGFGVINAVGIERMPVVVFVTAFDQYALQAFDAHALDYLLKPFDEERLQRTLRRVRERLQKSPLGQVSQRMLALLEQLDTRNRYVERLVIRQEGRATFLPVRDIDWIEADGKQICVHAGAARHVLREGMSRVEAQLDPAEFLRIHRSTIVRIDRIREIQPWFQGDYVVIMRDGTQLTSSRGYRDRLKDLLAR